MSARRARSYNSLALKTVLRISRPRFWLYLAGTFLIGVTAAATSLGDFTTPIIVVLFAYFLLPANIFLYGVNDLADEDTDAHNAKKGSREHLLRSQERAALTTWVASVAVLTVVLEAWLLLSGNILGAALLFLFLSLAVGYSVAPVRFKARPFFDSASNVLYAVPGFLGYVLVAGSLPSLPFILAFAAWTAAMHLFSAIPDIAADKKAHLRTSATALGHTGSLIACVVLWLVFAVVLVKNAVYGVLFAIAFVYPIIPFALLFAKAERVEIVYWYFPFLNGLLGFLAFWILVLTRLPLAALLGA